MSLSEVQVFITPKQDVYTSPNARYLPHIPSWTDVFSCEVHHPREASKVRWHSKMLPHLAYIACQPSFDNPILKRLACTYRDLPIKRDGGWHFLDQEIQDKWHQLETSLLWMVNVLLSAGRANLPLGWEPGPVPSICGYRNKHTEEVYARRCAMKSRDAFVPLMALCSWAISLVGTSVNANNVPRWVDLLLRENPAVQPSWIEDLTHSVIADFNIDRVGSFIPVKVDEDLKRTVAPMLRGNVPIWFHWGTVENPFGKYDSALAKYRPNMPQIDAARDTLRHNLVATVDPSLRQNLSNVPTINLPRGSRQMEGEAWRSYFNRMKAKHSTMESKESSMQKERRLARERHSRSGEAPGKKGATVFYWEKHDSGFRFRRHVPRADVAELWEEYAPSQRRYDGFTDEWDICTEFNPDAILPDEEDEVGDMPDVGIPPDNMNASPSISVFAPPPGSLDMSVLNEADPDYQPELSSNTPESSSRDTIVDIARYRYGLIVESTYRSGNPSILDWGVASRALGMEAREPIHPRVKHAICELTTSLIHLSNEDVRYPHKALWDLNDHSEESLFDRTNRSVSLRVEGTSIGRVCWIESQNLHPSRNAPWRLLVQDPVTAIECLRRGWGPHLVDIAFELYSRGIAFKTCLAVDRHITLDRPASTISLGYRLPDYVPSKRDYATYESIRNNFLSSPRARAALLKGGIIWRLAKDVVPEAALLSGPSSEAQRTGWWIECRDGISLDDDLSEDELNLISGVYRVFTGKGAQDSHLSWWPKHSTWAKSSLDIGFWTEGCEKWFQTRLERIRAGDAGLRSAQSWNNAIARVELKAKKVASANSALAGKALMGR